VGTERDKPAVPREGPATETPSVVELSDPSLWTRPKTTRSPDEAITDLVRMKTPASVATGTMVGAKCRRGETTYAMGWLKEGPNLALEDSGEGNVLRSTTEKDTPTTQVQGFRKEIKPLLLHYYLYIWIDGGIPMVASKLSMRDELSTLRLSSDQPLARDPWATLYSGAQGYNGHLGVDDYRQAGQGDEILPSLTFSLIALDWTCYYCTLVLP
jgi:hypothetical protein